MSITSSNSVAYAARIANEEDGWITAFHNSLKGVTFEAATYRPAEGVKCIWEVVEHTFQYTDALLAQLTGSPVPKVTDWRKMSNPTPAGWKKMRDKAMADSLRVVEIASGLTEAELASPPEGSKKSRAQRMLDIAIHNAYHAGQVMKLRELFRAR